MPRCFDQESIFFRAPTALRTLQSGGGFMSVTTALTPRHFAGVPFASWAFGIRVWIAVVIALYAGFWLELESPLSAAITVGILAVPTRGQALEKAGFRFLGTVIGVVASIALIGSLSQARDLFLLA